MKSEWQACTIGDLCDSVSVTYRGEDERVVLVNTSDVLNGKVSNHTDEPNQNLKGQFKKTFKRNDILYSEIRPANRRFAYIDFDETEKYIASTKLMVIRYRENVVEPKFLYFLLTSNDVIGELQRLAETRSGTFPQITFPAEVATLPVNLPPLPIQRKIASILSALDDKIETNNAICRNLEEQAIALYKSWFVDFEPFQKCVFEESEIGMIPRGWRVSKMSDFFPVITGKKNANVAGEKGQYPFFSCSQDILWTDDHSFEGNAILVAGNGDFNVKRYKGKFEAYQRTYVLIPDNPKLAGILYYAISKGLSDITIGARGSVINFITKGNIADYKIAIPNNLIDLPIITTINSLNETIDNLKAENQSLSQLRNALLPKLMSGEIDLSTII